MDTTNVENRLFRKLCGLRSIREFRHRAPEVSLQVDDADRHEPAISALNPTALSVRKSAMTPSRVMMFPSEVAQTPAPDE